MTVKEIADKLQMKVVAGDGSAEVKGFYACDLLSWVISHADTGNMWLTIMNNLNVVAVASLTEISCVVIAEGVEIDEAVITRAKEKEITLVSSSLPAAEIILKAYELMK